MESRDERPLMIPLMPPICSSSCNTSRNSSVFTDALSSHLSQQGFVDGQDVVMYAPFDRFFIGDQSLNSTSLPHDILVASDCSVLGHSVRSCSGSNVVLSASMVEPQEEAAGVAPCFHMLHDRSFTGNGGSLANSQVSLPEDFVTDELTRKYSLIANMFNSVDVRVKNLQASPIPIPLEAGTIQPSPPSRQRSGGFPERFKHSVDVMAKLNAAGSGFNTSQDTEGSKASATHHVRVVSKVNFSDALDEESDTHFEWDHAQGVRLGEESNDDNCGGALLNNNDDDSDSNAGGEDHAFTVTSPNPTSASSELVSGARAVKALAGSSEDSSSHWNRSRSLVLAQLEHSGAFERRPGDVRRHVSLTRPATGVACDASAAGAEPGDVESDSDGDDVMNRVNAVLLPL